MQEEAARLNNKAGIPGGEEGVKFFFAFVAGVRISSRFTGLFPEIIFGTHHHGEQTDPSGN
jgi:hypothetical protein